MTPSSACLDLIRHYETLKLAPYWDNGAWAVGWGHRIQKGEAKRTITSEEAEDLLARDVGIAASAVERMCKDIPLTQGQFDALVSFTYNMGAATLAASTLYYKLKGKDYLGAADQFGRWVKIGAVTSPWLVERRAAERALFLSQGADTMGGRTPNI